MTATYPASRAQPLDFVEPKDPSDSKTYQFDMSNQIETGETLASAAGTADSGITVVSNAVVGEVVNVKLSGGVAGRRYKVTVAITKGGSSTDVLNFTGVVSVANR